MSISIEAHDRICQDLHQQMRSLIVENERLKAAAQQALEAMTSRDGDSWTRRFARDRAIEALEAALAEPVQEPVAWSHINGTSDTKWHPPQRKPLTEEEIRDLWSWAMTAEAERTATTQQHAFARAIERAHGIGGQP